MSFVLPEVVVQRVIEAGIDNLRNNDAAFDEIFATFKCPELEADYGQQYIDKIRNWFKTTIYPFARASDPKLQAARK